MKNILKIALLVLTVIGLTACGPSDDEIMASIKQSPTSEQLEQNFSPETPNRDVIQRLTKMYENSVNTTGSRNAEIVYTAAKDFVQKRPMNADELSSWMKMDYDHSVRFMKPMVFVKNVHELTFMQTQKNSEQMPAIDTTEKFEKVIALNSAWCQWNTYFYSAQANDQIVKQYELMITTLGKRKMDKKTYSDTRGRSYVEVKPDVLLEQVVQAMNQCSKYKK